MLIIYRYEFYFDVVLWGQYTFEIGRMHEKYGPIIRINPYEIHVATPDFYEKLYAGPGNRRNKWKWFVDQFNIPESGFATADHDAHRIRRAAINPFFSKGAVRRLQPVIDERTDTLLARIPEFRVNKLPINMNHAFTAFTNGKIFHISYCVLLNSCLFIHLDVVHEYAFARSSHRVDHPDFDAAYIESLLSSAYMNVITKQFPWILPLIESLPESVMTFLEPNISAFLALERVGHTAYLLWTELIWVQDLQQQVREMKSGTRDDSKDADHRTIFYEIMNSNIPDKEKSFVRLWQDGLAIVNAGTFTTSWALCVAVFHLLNQPETLKNLKNELKALQCKTISEESTPTIDLASLEKLPYLTGCVQECIRLSYGVSSRLQRIAPDETLIFNDGTKDWSIPPGTPISMTSVLVHHDESIFPSSREFLPERWIGHAHLDRYLVSFSKGTRGCLGINLAYAELYTVLSRLFMAYGSKEVREEGDVGYLELYETSLDDVELARDFFIPFPKDGSQGIRVLVKE